METRPAPIRHQAFEEIPLRASPDRDPNGHASQADAPSIGMNVLVAVRDLRMRCCLDDGMVITFISIAARKGCATMTIMKKLKVRRIGNSLGVILPKEVLEQLGAKEGDELVLTRAQDAWLMARRDEKFHRTMKHAEEFINKYRNTLRELAK